jgi:alkylation response protein AidB-like acyl-CoA dehydrogenase
MDFVDSPEQANFRAEARAWIAQHAPHELYEVLKSASFGDAILESPEMIAASKAWQKRKQAGGWACIHWPHEYGGRAATPIEEVIWQEEEGVYGLLGKIVMLGQGMCAPTLIAWATEEQKRRFLPKLASADEIWCQLFSEPAAGSDLAGLRTRAEPRDGGWLINGQKVWTSHLHYANYAILLARTDSSVPKHEGLTMFFLAVDTPGLTHQPIKQITGQSGFNEVFFTDVLIPDSQRLGPVGHGWKAALTTLMNERLTVGNGGMPTGFKELFAYCSQAESGGRKLVDDPWVRSRLATWAVRASGLKHTASRSITALCKGHPPGPEASIGKLVAGATMQEIAMFALELQGEAGVLHGERSPADGRFQAMLLRSAGTRIEGGTDEILRGIVGERVLGLPSDARADKGIPFNKILTGR